MHINYKTFNDWVKDYKPNFKDEFQANYDFFFNVSKAFAEEVRCRYRKYTQDLDVVDIKLNIDPFLLRQAMVDAYDDLKRLTDYHPTQDPNPIKRFAYFMYWVVRRKPIIISNYEELKIAKLPQRFQEHLLHINEYYAVQFLIYSAFPKKKLECKKKEFIANNQLTLFEDHLFYYLVYRVNTPKELETIILATTMHPAWEVDPSIWK